MKCSSQERVNICGCKVKPPIAIKPPKQISQYLRSVFVLKNPDGLENLKEHLTRITYSAHSTMNMLILQRPADSIF